MGIFYCCHLFFIINKIIYIIAFMRGSRSLYNNLLFEDDTTTTTEKNIGRSADLISKRDEKLVHRHYYYLKIYGLQYQAILEQLSIEFDLTITTIVERLQMSDNDRLLNKLRKEKTPLQQLRKLYPFFNWPPPKAVHSVN